MQTMTIDRMREMNLTQMARRLSEMSDDPKCHDLNWKDAVASLIDAEYDHRSTRRLQELLRKARLKYPAATLETLDCTIRSEDCPRTWSGNCPTDAGSSRRTT
jgi:hypothetical protein